MHSDIVNGLSFERIPNGRGGLELRLYPQEAAGKTVARRQAITGRPECETFAPMVVNPDSMVQVKLEQDGMSGGFISGTTMQDSLTTLRLVAVEPSAEDRAGHSADTVVTCFENRASGLRVCHYATPTPVAGTLVVHTVAKNTGTAPIKLESLSSFVLSGITPFAPDEAAGRLRLHRFRSWWSNEGSHENLSLEELHLIRNWQGGMLPNERFGQIGTMPVRKFFPFVAVEDTEAGVLWGAQIAWAGSWQIEVSRRGDAVSISGGLADYEFGHWKKELQPGESFSSPKAYVACVSGTIENLCAALVRAQEALLPEPPEVEKDLPVIFNEWCTNWGSPSHDKTLALAERLRGCGVRYIVIDDGWAKRPPEATAQSNGDWIVDTEKFPLGMKATCDELRKMGFVPGVWFEFEVCNPAAEAYQLSEHFLHRDGRVIESGSRRFWNLNDPWVIDYLDKKLISFLRDNGFGYLKVDYNDTFGLGSEHPDSVGEGLRHHVDGIHSTFERIRDGVPDIVIENCSSGGHRLEPSMMARTSMSSFSDAHETTNIPIIARQLHHLLPPRQSQIWAVLKPADSAERLVYSLAATFYGRMCLSGPVHDLSDAQMDVVKQSTALYAKAAPVIRDGFTSYIGQTPANWYNPVGWSGVLRLGDDGKRALVVAHEYERADSSDIRIELPHGDWRIVGSLEDGTTAAASLANGVLTLSHGNGFRGYVFLLERQ